LEVADRGDHSPAAERDQQGSRGACWVCRGALGLGVWEGKRERSEKRNLGGTELVGPGVGGREGGAEQGLKIMSKSMRRREETSPLCQQEHAEGQAAGGLLLEGYLGGKCREAGAQAEGSHGGWKKEEIQELALLLGVCVVVVLKRQALGMSN